MSLTYETNEHIALITIDREKALNSIDLDTWQELSEAIDRLNNEDDSWVGIITGAGEKAFCAGADLRATGDQDTVLMQEAGPAERRNSLRYSVYRVPHALEQLDKP